MNSSALRSLNAFLRATAVFAGGALLFVQAEAAVPNPCSLVTAAEMQAIVGPLSGTPEGDRPGVGRGHLYLRTRQRPELHRRLPARRGPQGMEDP